MMRIGRRQALHGLAGLAAGGVLAGCGVLAPRQSLNIVLVHGSWHGPWCWEKLVPLLRAEGHGVSAVDLQAGRPPAQSTLAAYVKQVTDALDAHGAPSILVAHSSGGIHASQAAEERPEKVRSLVFVSGFVLANGESGRDAFKPGSDPATKLPPLFRPDFRPGTKIPLQIRLDASNPAAVKDALYGDCGDAEVRAAIARLVPEPAAPGGQALRLTPERFGRVDKAYVFCSKDNAISPVKQREFAGKWPMRRTATLDSSHSPMLSMPERLARTLTAELLA
jgi:pimeloyl-ACP methyl ester carboxylesterase